MKIISLAVVLAVFALLSLVAQQYLYLLSFWLENSGYLAPILFLLFYSLATLLFLPTIMLTLAGGALFGLVTGTLLNVLGATLGAAMAFLISRYCAYSWFSQWQDRRIKRLVAEVEQRGWQVVAILRLFPLIPFNLVNYALGMTGIGFRLYLLTTFVFLIPPEIIYTYFGYAGMSILGSSTVIYSNAVFGFLAAFILAVILFRLVRRRRL